MHSLACHCLLAGKTNWISHALNTNHYVAKNINAKCNAELNAKGCSNNTNNYNYNFLCFNDFIFALNETIIVLFVRFSYINYVNRKTSTKKVSFDIKMDPSNIILEDSVDGDNDDCNRKQVKVSPTKLKSVETKKRLIL